MLTISYNSFMMILLLLITEAIINNTASTINFNKLVK